MVSPGEFNESAGSVELTVTTWCQNEIEMRYESQDATAEAKRDYSPVSGTMRLSYDKAHRFELTVLQDRLIEGYESLSLVIAGVPGGGGGFGPGNDVCLGGGPYSSETFTLTIVDDDIAAQDKQSSGAGGRTTGSGSSGAAVAPGSGVPSEGNSSEDSQADDAVPPAEPQSHRQEALNDQLRADAASGTRSNGVGLAMLLATILTIGGVAAISAIRTRGSIR